MRGQVQTKCHALQDFARGTAAAASSQQNRRLNHREAEGHLLLQFRGRRVDSGDCLSDGWYTAVLSHDGQGGGLQREVAKLDKREDDSMAILETSYWDVNTDAVMAPAWFRARVEVASLVRWILWADSGNGLHGWHAVTQGFRPRSVVEQASLMARLIYPAHGNGKNSKPQSCMGTDTR